MRVSDVELAAAFDGIDVPVDRAATADEILALVDGTGDEHTRVETLARLMATADGRRELAMVQALHDGFQAGGAVEVHATTVRAAGRWLRPSALAAALLCVALLGIQRSRERDAASVLRGGPAIVTLLAPVEGRQATGNITFAWRHIAGASYELEVYSAEGAAIARRLTADTTIVLRTGTVPGGDYRWWVTAQLEDGTQVRSATRRLELR